ncbi:hypothetical protein DUNSADRAFT_1568 [Dunaliella salina]|uniref:Encoded protein n=1 Tax=Dunaliella salina TaxID=3046 RepID=A0ABZ3KCT0_DUNSA|nr:hypothetical protein DUNSADRAFT_1568 [Dunaliella salina]|eukprot:KAF5826978.1 hypothetical protein DUNSADRAFT_1568 [Dunaliella salina]
MAARVTGLKLSLQSGALCWMPLDEMLLRSLNGPQPPLSSQQTARQLMCSPLGSKGLI